MAKVLEALISKGRRVKRAVEQKEVAFGLADLSTHEDLLERMVLKGSVKSLLMLLTKSSDKDARRFASLAIANLSSAAFNRTRIASEGSIPVLIDIMKDLDSDIIARQYCAMAIGNLAAEPDNHLEIVKSDGIEALISVLKTEDVDAGRYAAFGLANIGANANHRDRIVELGAVPGLISLACSEDINAQRQALAGLRSVCISPEFRAVVVREGAMDALVLLSRVEDIGILREVASAINCLSSVEENKTEIADRAMSTVIGLMLSGDLVIERHAVCAAANLMEMLELHVRLTEERGVAPIVAIAASVDPNSRGEACRCLANLSVNPDMHQIIIREGSLRPLVGALSQQELNCQRYASLCLANLSTTVAAQVKVIQMGAVKPLIELGTNPSHQIEARRYAALALANLTATAANHMTVIEDGGLHAFFSLCNSPDLMSQYYVGCALANLSSSISNHYIIVETGGLQALITLVSSKDPDVHQQASAALRGLAVTPINKMKIVQEGALNPLTLLLSSEDVEILREVVACFCNLSASEENKLEIAKCGTIPAFIALSQNPDMVVGSMACATLANLAEIQVNQDLITMEGAIRPTISVMRSKYIEVQREAGRLLANLCSSTAESTSGIIEAGGHSLLISYLLSQDTACQRVGSMGICNLCTQSRFRRVLMECGVVEPLCALARSDDVELEIQRYAILAIANLASATDIHNLFIEEGMLALLVALSTANDAEVRQYAAYAVTKIAQNADVRNSVTEEGGLESVLYLSRTDEAEILKEVLPALCSLSFSDANKIAICRNGGLESVVRGLRDGEMATKRLACCTIANLAEMVENYDRIYDSLAIPPIVRALGECAANDSIESSYLQKEAARALGNLAANIELGDIIMREGALPYLLPMVRADDPNTQRLAAYALANLSSNAKNHPSLIAGGIFEVLLVEITHALDPKSRSDFECTRYCLLVYTNLAISPTYHQMIMKQALNLLSQFSKHRDIKCRQHAVFCLANLCTNKDNLEDIIASGCLRTIITYAFPSSESSSNVQFQAIAGLRGMSTHPLIRIQIVRDGALEPLIVCARSPSIEVQREAAATMCNLALAEENKVILARGGALSALVSLAMSGDRQRELHAVAAMANIAEMVEGRTQERMIEEGCLKPLIKLSESDDSEIRREVSRAFALFASKRDSHNALIRAHVASRIMALLTDKQDDVCRRYAALGIANLAVARDTHQELFDVGAIAELISISSSSDLPTRRAVAFAINNLASNPANHSACERLGIVRYTIALLRDHDRDTNLQAIIATRRLCESARCRNQFLDLNGIAPLLDLGGHLEDLEIKREIAATFRNISLSENGKVAIIKQGSKQGLHLICEFLNHPDTEVCHQGAGIIANLAESIENQGPMVDEGVLQNIKFIMRSKSIDIQREGARAMANISAEYTYAPAIVAAGALIPLIATLSSPDYLCQRYAVMGVGNLACNPSNQKKIVQEGGIPPLLSLARFENGDIESQKYAAIALTNLSATKSNHAILVDLGVVELATFLLGHEDKGIRATCSLLIANFASNPTNHQLLVKEGSLLPMLQLLTNGGHLPSDSSQMANSVIMSTEEVGMSVQLHVLSCIRGLSTDANIRLDLLDYGILPTLLHFAKAANLDLQTEALACLCNLSLTGCIKDNSAAFLEDLTVRRLLSFLCSSDATYRLLGAVVVGNLAASVPIQSSLVSAGAIGPLVSVGNASDLETQRSIAYALCNLASNPAYRHNIVREGGLAAIISLACSTDDATDQLIALSTLRGIASHPENARHVYQAGVSEAIGIGGAIVNNKVGGAEGSFEEEEIKCEISALLCALSVDSQNKGEMIANSTILSVLSSLLDQPAYLPSQDRYLRPAMACLANLSEDLEYHSYLRQQQYHVPVLNYLLTCNEADITTYREGVRYIANLATYHNNQDAILAAGGLAALLECCLFDDAVVCRLATIAVMNLATYQDNARLMLREFPNFISVLSDLANGAPRTYRAVDRLGNVLEAGIITSSEQLQESSPADLALEYPEYRPSPKSSQDGNFVASFGYDLETRRYALLALGNLCSASQQAVDLLLLPDTLPSVIDSLLPADQETQTNAAFTLCKLAGYDSALTVLGASPSCFDNLTSFLNNLSLSVEGKDLPWEAAGLAIATLRNLAKLPTNRPLIVSHGALEPLARIAAQITVTSEATQNNLEILREIVGLTTALSLVDGLRSSLASSPLISTVLTLCANADVEIGRLACTTVANLAEAKRIHKQLALIETSDTQLPTDQPAYSATHSGAMGQMIACLRHSRHMAIHREAARAVANLLASSAYHRLFLDGYGIEACLPVLQRSLDTDTLTYLVLIYRRLTPYLQTHETLIKKRCLPTILSLSRTQEGLITRHAALSMRDMASNPAARLACVEAGYLTRATELASDSDRELRVLGLGILRHLAVNTRIKPLVVSEGGIQSVFLNIEDRFNYLSEEAQSTESSNPVNDQNIKLNPAPSEEARLATDNQSKNLGADILRQCAGILTFLCEDSDLQVRLVENEVLPRLVSLVNFSDSEVHTAVARCFASITSHPTCLVGVFGQIEYKAILKLLSPHPAKPTMNPPSQVPQQISTHLSTQQSSHMNSSVSASQSSEDLCIRDALVALGNLVVTEINTTLLANLGGIPIISQLLSHSSADVVLYATRCLYRIAYQSSNIPAILATNLFPKLIHLIGRDSPSYLNRKYATMLLTNLSSISTYLHVLVKSNVLEGLIYLLNDSSIDDSVVQYSLMIATNLTVEPTFQLLITKLGLLEPIARLIGARDRNPEVSRYACLALSNLSSNRQNRVKIVGSGVNAHETIIDLLLPVQHTPPPTRMPTQQSSQLSSKLSSQAPTRPVLSLEQSRALGLVLYNLTCASATHSYLVRANATPAIVQLGSLSDLQCQTYAAMCIANLASNNETRSHAIRQGGLQLAIKLLKCQEISVARYACLALCNMACNLPTQEQIIVHGALPTLLSMVGSNSNDELSMRQALLVVVNLTTSDSNHATLHHYNLPAILLATYHRINDTCSQEYIAYALANLCGNPTYLPSLGKIGVIPPLIKLSAASGEGSLDSKCLAISALRRLASSEENWTFLIQEGILDTLAAVAGYAAVDRPLDVNEIDIQKEVAATVCALSLSPTHRIEVAYKLVTSLVYLLSHLPDKEAIRQILGAVANLAEEVSTHEYLAKGGAYDAIIKYILPEVTLTNSESGRDLTSQVTRADKATYTELKREASRALANLLSSFRHQNLFLDAPESTTQKPGIELILEMILSSDDEECTYHGALCLRKIAPNLKAHASIGSYQGFKALFKLISGGSSTALTMQTSTSYLRYNICRQSLCALRDILASPTYKRLCCDEGGVEVLVSILKDNDEPTLLALALSCLRHLSIPNELKSAVLQDNKLDSEHSKKKLLRHIVRAMRSHPQDEDVYLQAMGLVANLSEEPSNLPVILDDGILPTIINVAHGSLSMNLEILQDCSRVLANICADEELHVRVYKQGILAALLQLSAIGDDVITRYSSIGIRFLATDSDIRTMIVKDGHIDAFIALAKPGHVLDYHRTSAMALASFTLHEDNKPMMIRQPGCISTLIQLASCDDLTAKRESVFALANLCEVYEFQEEIVVEGVLRLFNELVASTSDAKIQRDLARGYSYLAQYDEIQTYIMATAGGTNQGGSSKGATSPGLHAIMSLTRSLDIPCQRYAALALCSICSSQYKESIVQQGALRPLTFLLRFPDVQIQKYSSLAIGGLALGGHGLNKQQIVSEGCLRPLIELITFPERQVQYAAMVAINCIVLGQEANTKAIVMTEGGLIPIIKLIEADDAELDMIAAVVYALGSLAEHPDIRIRLVELHAIHLVVMKFKHLLASDQSTPSHVQNTASILDIQRAIAYFVATLSQQVDLHNQLASEGVFEILVALACLDDIECQEYATFSLAHIASSREHQVRLASVGAIRPLVTLLSSEAEPKHYAGLALLKLADNFENHGRIAEEGGIQALLRLGRSRAIDEQVQYKAALSVGQLASNAIRLLPSMQPSREGRIGHGAKMLTRLTTPLSPIPANVRLKGNNAAAGAELTKAYLSSDDEAMRRAEEMLRRPGSGHLKPLDKLATSPVSGNYTDEITVRPKSEPKAKRV